jgi:N-formylglutamate amidohydrolase
MDAKLDYAAVAAPPMLEILAPEEQAIPVVVASPHSGNVYPPALLAASRLDPLALRKSEDSFVDELFGGAPRIGAPLLRALFPRAYIDANREPFELDPAMFHDKLPNWVKTRSPRISAGLGTIARVVANGQDIYLDKLRFADALDRVKGLHEPYHTTLKHLVQRTRDRFGYCMLIDAHSMPSACGPMDWDIENGRVDFVLGDCHGTSCAPALTNSVEAALKGQGYPYPGGYTTRHYGQPADGVHVLQIEVNRGLYMNETTIERGSYMPALIRHLSELIGYVGRLDHGALAV